MRGEVRQCVRDLPVTPVDGMQVARGRRHVGCPSRRRQSGRPVSGPCVASQVQRAASAPRATWQPLGMAYRSQHRWTHNGERYEVNNFHHHDEGSGFDGWCFEVYAVPGDPDRNDYIEVRIPDLTPDESFETAPASEVVLLAHGEPKIPWPIMRRLFHLMREHESGDSIAPRTCLRPDSRRRWLERRRRVQHPCNEHWQIGVNSGHLEAGKWGEGDPDSSTPTVRFRWWAMLRARREAWWPGAGSNRRRSDFQGARPKGRRRTIAAHDVRSQHRPDRTARGR